MESLTLEQASYLAEIIGVLAVVVSLIYVGLQVKQNTHVVRLNTVHNIAEGQREVNALMAANGDLCDVIFKGLQDAESVSGAEKMRFYILAHVIFRPLEDAYFQYQERALEEKQWQALSRQFMNFIKLPGFVTYWEDRKFMYSDDFQQYMDDEVIPAPLIHDFKLAGT